MIKSVAVATLAVVTLAGATVSPARSEDNSNAKFAVGAMAAIAGALLVGKAYQKHKEKREEKKVMKKGLRNFQAFQKDSAGDPAAFKAKWAPICQKVIADLKAANCTGQSSLKCRKIAADCPM